jgi:hypothetical protein
VSDEEILVSLSGSPIINYTDGEREWESTNGEDCIEEISDHIERNIGQIETVIHETVSDTIHIDIHHVPPTSERPFHTLISSGMSNLPMKVPGNVDATRHMELMVTLPENWEIGNEQFQNENWYWPVRELRFLARFPHKYDTWLGWGHTLPNGDPAEAFSENCSFIGIIILPSINVPKEFYTLEINKEKLINFFSIVPLYQEEMDFKLQYGTDALLAKFNRFGVSDIINPNRKNVAKKQFGLF